MSSGEGKKGGTPWDWEGYGRENGLLGWTGGQGTTTDGAARGWDGSDSSSTTTIGDLSPIQPGGLQRSAEPATYPVPSSTIQSQPQQNSSPQMEIVNGGQRVVIYLPANPGPSFQPIFNIGCQTTTYNYFRGTGAEAGVNPQNNQK